MLKKYNGIVGRFFECTVVAIINKENIYKLWNTKETININTIPLYNEILKDAYAVVKTQFSTIQKAIWTNNPFTDCGDIVLDDNIHVELKYVNENGATGTYHNTSIKILERYDIDILPYFQKYLHPIWNKYKLSHTKSQISLTKQSKSYLKSLSNYEEIYKEIAYQANLLDNAIRNDLYVKLNNETEMANIFINDMINKKRSSGKLVKGTPNLYVVFNFSNKTIKKYSKTELLTSKSENVKLVGENSINFNQIFRATVSWQNGLGIQNPTLRIFLEK